MSSVSDGVLEKVRDLTSLLVKSSCEMMEISNTINSIQYELNVIFLKHYSLQLSSDQTDYLLKQIGAYEKNARKEQILSPPKLRLVKKEDKE